MERNFAAEMRAVIDAETAHGSYSAPLVAEHVVEKLRATDPDLLHGWLDSQAVQFVRHAINLRDCSVRAHNRGTRGRSVFAQAAEAAESGNLEPLKTGFLDERYVIEDGTKARLGDMVKPDLLFAADDYAARKRENALQEAFLRALAKKVGSDCVSDHFDEGRLAELWQSISGR